MLIAKGKIKLLDAKINRKLQLEAVHFFKKQKTESLSCYRF